MDDERKNIEDIAKDFQAQWSKALLPNMEAEDLLDLMDYYARMGMTFEAELCRYIVNKQYANDPEVVLMQAHASADDGDWLKAAILRNEAGITGYDDTLFKVEHSIRLGQIAEAKKIVHDALPPIQHAELADYDFIFDVAVLFRNFGYCTEALQFTERIPFNYVDYNSVLQLRVECHIYLREFYEAKSLLDDMLDKAAFDQTLWTNMACCCYELGEDDETIEACEYALAIGEAPEARHFRLMTHIRKNGGQPNDELLQAIMEEQDYRSCTEYADTVFKQGHYDEAITAYSFANLFCPQSSRDREYILSQLIISHIHNDTHAELFTHIKALLAIQGDCWETLLEVARLLLEKGDWIHALIVLNNAEDAHIIQNSRYNQVVGLLAHYNCYKALYLWQAIFNHETEIYDSYKPFLAKAHEALGI